MREGGWEGGREREHTFSTVLGEHPHHLEFVLLFPHNLIWFSDTGKDTTESVLARGILFSGSEYHFVLSQRRLSLAVYLC